MKGDLPCRLYSLGISFHPRRSNKKRWTRRKMWKFRDKLRIWASWGVLNQPLRWSRLGFSSPQARREKTLSWASRSLLAAARWFPLESWPSLQFEAATWIFPYHIDQWIICSGSPSVRGYSWVSINFVAVCSVVPGVYALAMDRETEGERDGNTRVHIPFMLVMQL